MTAKQKQRIAAHFPDGKPKYIRCYDNGGETLDRYTVVFTGNYRALKRNRIRQALGPFFYYGFSPDPFHGVGSFGESYEQIDRPQYSHLGKPIPFSELPVNCQLCTVDSYVAIWGLPEDIVKVYRWAKEMYPGYGWESATNTLLEEYPGLPVSDIVQTVYIAIQTEDVE